MEDLVSAIIITYKRPVEILKRAIMSVINQRYRELEIIVVNDAPEELALAQDIQFMIDDLQDSRIVYHEHEKNMGANQARNTGLKMSRGKYVAFLDDDDEWLPEKIKEQVIEMQTSDTIGLVGCDFCIKNGEKEYIRNTEKRMANWIQSILVSNFIGSTSFPLIRKAVFDEIGVFDVNMKACQEYELWIRILSRYDCRIIHKPLGVYYQSQDSTFKASLKFASADQLILQKHSLLFSENIEASFMHCTEMYLSMLRAKDWENARWFKKKALTYNRNIIDNLTLVMLLRKVAKKTAKARGRR